MPYMHFAGRKWRVSSDDFLFPFLLSSVIEFFWLMMLVVFLASHDQWAFACVGGDQLRAFYALAIALTSLKFLHACLLAWQSGRGTIRQERKRRYVPILLWFHLLFNLPISLLLYGYGFYLAFKPYDCSLQTVIIARCVCLVGFAVACLSLSAAFFMTLGPCFSFTEPNDSGGTCSFSFLSPDFWSRLVSFLCCTRYDETTRHAFENVHRILLAYFHEYDLTPSDLALGVLLLNRRHLDIIVTAPPAVPPDSEADWCSLEQLQYYVKYANACYGWPLEVFNNPCLCCCTMGPHCAPCSCCRPNRTGIWGCDLAAVIHQTGLTEAQILYYDFRAEVNQAAFYLARDDERKCIVLGVRGTLSLSDALTDLQVAMVQVDQAAPAYQAHAGIVQCARAINAKVSESVLQAAMEENPDYRLVVVGHSLGAGVAALLGYLLRRKYPRLVCYCYSPPLQVVTPEFAEHCKQFVCCCSLGEDLFSHMNITNINDFQDRLLCALYNCDKPKFREFLSSLATLGSVGSDASGASSVGVGARIAGYASIPSRGYSDDDDEASPVDGPGPPAAALAAPPPSATEVDSPASARPGDSLLCQAKRAFRVANDNSLLSDDGNAAAADADPATQRRASDLLAQASLHSCFYSSQPVAVFPGWMLHLVETRGPAARRYAQLRDSQAASSANCPALAAVWSSPEYFCQLQLTRASLAQHLPHSVTAALHRLEAVTPPSVAA
ncbi:hypothetical protein BOX15_Mlig000541g5 [Macrostomum lignano]|uniref:sn-1-specific diacylglycerol lipase n=1 Tax=Macrostomum lignano TaxID=282301 RepID=A0A267G835_9PLAT|nr:hypothetical protein BOX15_Mlig000541g5 [Macrostomum lignano]